MRIQFPRTVAAGLLLGLLIGLTSAVSLTVAGRPTAVSSHTILFYLDSVGEANVLANETIRVLCFNNGTASQLVDDVKVTTDLEGAIKIPDQCPYFAAMQQVDMLPSGKGERPAATVYRTSFAPNSNSVNESATTTEVVLDSNSYLMLFHVVVSVAWQPEPGSDYIDNLIKGLRLGSGFLFDATEGRMAFGEIRVETNGRSWDEADIRIKAANDFRPAAYVGGIVPEYTVYHSKTNPEVGDIVYAPGAVFLGRNWTRNGAYDAPAEGWAHDDSYKTIVHEWAHYALFLYDEYLSDTGTNVFCTVPGQHPSALVETAETPSIMEWHYHTSEFWLDEPNEADCFESLQFTVHNAFEWDTLDIWDEIFGLGSNYIQKPVGPLMGNANTRIITPLFATSTGFLNHLPLIVKLGTPPTPPDETQNVSLALVDPSGEFGENGTVAPSHVYLVELDESSNMAKQIIHQGTFLPNGEDEFYGKIEVVGADSDSKLRVFFDRYQDKRALGGENYVYLENSNILDLGGKVNLEPNPWPATLTFDWEFADERLNRMLITISSVEEMGDVTVQLCVPEATRGCFWDATTSSFFADGRYHWKTVFDVDESGVYPEVPLYGIVRAFSEKGGEVINWYQVAGGVGPAHMFIDAPMVEGAAMVNTPLFPEPLYRSVQGGAESLFGPCSRVIYSPAVDFDARLTDAPLANYKFISQPLELDILAQAPGGDCTFASGDRPLAAAMHLTLFYNQDWVDTVGAVEADGRILYFDRPDSPTKPSLWRLILSDVPNNLIDGEMNRLSTENGITFDGIYVLVSEIP